VVEGVQVQGVLSCDEQSEPIQGHLVGWVDLAAMQQCQLGCTDDVVARAFQYVFQLGDAQGGKGLE
jgi:hypothetical protein